MATGMLYLARRSFRSPLARSLFASAVVSLHTLPDLPYAYNALEPYISEEIMTLHHKKHHQTYVTGLNAAEEARSPTMQCKGISTTHFFWRNLAPASEGGGKLENGPLKSAIERDFGSVDEFKKSFNAKTAGIQGSGWGWLGYNSTTNKLEIVTTANQDPLITHTPIIGIDIWEHAFYLQYKNAKPDYLNAIWNVVNFKEAERRLEAVAK
ncbi:Mn superoxide dismutase [Mycena metata]|uniref:Superoxide dismutase n=1 Tax=Mycena metata TaxID=1033252 RepID=A0AAD7I4R3_9AGAR|nr:Mn superoxide dismutase [Mycena metata]